MERNTAATTPTRTPCARRRRKRACGLALAVGATLSLAPPADAGPTAREIMQKVDARDDGDQSTALLEMILIDGRGFERRRSILHLTKDYGEDTREIIFFLSPADVQDTAFLTYDYRSAEQDDDQWLYVPALKRTRRIASADQSRSFVGSDFSYADLTRLPLERYDFELMQETDVRGHAAWQIQATPKGDEEVDRTGSFRAVYFVRKDNYVVVRAASWLRGKKVKYLDVKELEQVDGIWVRTEMHMTTKRGDEMLHKTILRTSRISFDESHPDSTFTTRQLEKGP